MVGEAQIGGLTDLAADPIPGAPVAGLGVLPAVDELAEGIGVGPAEIEAPDVAGDIVLDLLLEHDLGHHRGDRPQLVAAVQAGGRDLRHPDPLEIVGELGRGVDRLQEVELGMVRGDVPAGHHVHGLDHRVELLEPLVVADAPGAVVRLLVHREVLVLVLQADLQQPDLLVDARPLGGGLEEPTQLVQHVRRAEHRIAARLQRVQLLLQRPQLRQPLLLEPAIVGLEDRELLLDRSPRHRRLPVRAGGRGETHQQQENCERRTHGRRPNLARTLDRHPPA